MGVWIEFFGEGLVCALDEAMAEKIFQKISRRILFYFFVIFILVLLIIVIYYTFYYVEPVDYSTFWKVPFY